MNTEQSLSVKKSEILFLYQSTYSIPNGDPFTGEQRYDEETKKILVSDVRMKRFIRDYLARQGEEIYVTDDKSKLLSKKGESKGAKSETSSALRVNALSEKYEKDGLDASKILCKCIDVRLFGAVSTKEKAAINLTGPVQFALLNPSINKVDMMMHQNTSVFASSEEKSRGSIATTSIVPYALMQIHGWINPYSALETGLTEDDIQKMFKALWNGVNDSNTRSKSNQDSLLLLRFVYSDPTRKVYDLAQQLRLNLEHKKDEQLRGRADYKFDFNGLGEKITSSFVQEVEYYTEDLDLEESLKAVSSAEKLKKMAW